MPSTVIRHFSYDPDTQRLTIVFQSGRRYAYHDVSPETYAGLRSAPSRGAYFNTWIRDHHPFARLDAPSVTAR